jgi:hypothetical protein
MLQVNMYFRTHCQCILHVEWHFWTMHYSYESFMFKNFILHVAKLWAKYECLVYTWFTIYRTVPLIYLFLFVMQLSTSTWAGVLICELLTLFPVEHTNALDRAVVEYQLAETTSTGRSNCLGAGLTALDRRDAENLDSLLREGPRQEQCA